jgi:hypothetical protein|tara:strand:+ start:84 stop:1394 length:1311 start_codon:yes stop_codon:yes gene_type:complete
MASETSGINVVNRGTSGGDSYYNTTVTTLPDGGAKRETYRVDSDGSNRVLLQTVTVDKDKKITSDVQTSDITVEERRDLLNRNSSFRKIITSQVSSVSSNLSNGTSSSVLSAVSGGSGNETVNDPGEFTPTEYSNFELDEIKIEGNRKRRYENLFYPEDISESRQDRMRFTMFFQSGRSIGFDLDRENPFNLGTRTVTNIEGSVTLPIQVNSDTNSVDFNEGKLNPIMGTLAATALNPGQTFSQILSILNESPEEIQQRFSSVESKNLISAIRVFLAQQAIGGQNLLSRTSGAILNPNIELLLNSPQLRSHRFTFTMSPRSSSEAKQVRKIIRFFKQGMSVKTSDTSLFIVSPNMFKIQYIAGGNESFGSDHPSLGKIKDCALTAMTTKYGDGNTYMTYDDPARTMTSYTIEMAFTELTPLTEDDYTDIRDDEIGF